MTTSTPAQVPDGTEARATAPGTASPAPEIRKGLAGVVVDVTAISKVNPETNSLLYRGYPVQELAANCTFEEVAYLLWHGELPTPVQLEELQSFEREHRALSGVAKDAIDLLPLDAHPMDVVRTAVSAYGAADPTVADADADTQLDQAKRLWAQLPAIVAYTQRRDQPATVRLGFLARSVMSADVPIQSIPRQ